MEPENFTLVGTIILFAGFCVIGVGGFLFYQYQVCSGNLASCGLYSNDLPIRIGFAFPLIVLGGIATITGAIFTAAGYITGHVNLRGVTEEESADESAKPPP